MKSGVFLAGMGLWVGLGMGFSTSWGADDYRVFTDVKGRTIQGMVTACDPARNQVTVERKEDHQRVTVPINIFSKADQAYVKEWYMGHELISDQNLKISCKEKTLKRWKKNDSTEMHDAAGGYIGDRLDIKKFEKIVYEVTLQNSGEMPFKNFRLEYKIYYEQSEKAENPEPQQKVLKASEKMEPLGKGKSATMETKSVDVYTEQISMPSGVSSSYTPAGGKGRVHGLRGRIYVVLPSGKEVMREFSEPESLSEQRFPW